MKFPAPPMVERRNGMKVKVLKCECKEFEGKIVDIYYAFSNGIDFVTKYGLVFVKKGDYEVVE